MATLWRAGLCLGSWDLDSVASTHLARIDSEKARDALLNSFKACPPPADTRLATLPIDDKPPPHNWAQSGGSAATAVTLSETGAGGGVEADMELEDSNEENEVDDEEEEEFDEGRYAYAGGSRRSFSTSSPADSPRSIDSTPPETNSWREAGSLLCPSLQVPTAAPLHRLCCQNTCPLLPYRLQGPLAPRFRQPVLDQKRSRAMALDNIPLMSRLLRSEEPSHCSHGRSSRRASGSTMQMQMKYPYFYEKAKAFDFEMEDLLTVIELGRIDLLPL